MHTDPSPGRRGPNLNQSKYHKYSNSNNNNNIITTITTNQYNYRITLVPIPSGFRVSVHTDPSPGRRGPNLNQTKYHKYIIIVIIIITW